MATLPRSSLAHVVQQAAIPLPERVTIGLEAVAETASEGLLALSVRVGLAVVAEIFDVWTPPSWWARVASTVPSGRLTDMAGRVGS